MLTNTIRKNIRYFLFILTALSMFVVIEGMARVGMFLYTGNKIYLTYFNSYKPLNVFNTKVEHHQAGKNIYYKGIPNLSYNDNNVTITYNSKGFRSDEFDKTPKKIRIACFGGSETWGAVSNDKETYPAYLNEHLEDIFFDSFEVINAGFGSYNTTTIKNLIKEEFIYYRPDIIIINGGYNDHTGGLTGGLPKITRRSSVISIWNNNIHRYISSKSLFYYIARKFLNKGNTLNAIRTGERIVQRYNNNMNEIISICKEKNIKLVLIKQPIYCKSTVASSAESGLGYGKYYKQPFFKTETFDKIKEDFVGKVNHARYGRTYYYQSLLFHELEKFNQSNHDIVVLDFVNDLLALHEEGTLLFNDIIHLNNEGNNLFSRMILDDNVFIGILERCLKEHNY